MHIWYVYIYMCVCICNIYIIVYVIYIYIIVKDSSMAMFTLFDFIGSSWSESAWPQTQNWTNSSRKSVMVRMARSERCMEILCPQTSGSEKKNAGLFPWNFPWIFDVYESFLRNFI